MQLISKDSEFKIKGQWEIPLEGSDGFIIEKSSGEVLSPKQRKDCSYGSRVKLKPKEEGLRSCQAKKDTENWLRSKMDDQGWFTLKNLENGQLLTAKGKKKFELSGMLDKAARLKMSWYEL